MRAANLLHANVHGLVLSGVSSPCRCACNADAFAWHFALHLELHSVQSSSALGPVNTSEVHQRRARS